LTPSGAARRAKGRGRDGRDERRLLAVVLEGSTSAELRRALAGHGDLDSVRIVAPPALGTLHWLVSDEDDARAEASDRAAAAADQLPDEAVVGRGDGDPVQAVEDTLREFSADEILIVGRPDDGSLELELAGFGLPVRRAGGAPPPVPGDELRREAHRVVAGRSRATPFAFLAGVQPTVLVVAGVVLVLVLLAIWLL
jgi:hypothetical protein